MNATCPLCGYQFKHPQPKCNSATACAKRASNRGRDAQVDAAFDVIIARTEPADLTVPASNAVLAAWASALAAAEPAFIPGGTLERRAALSAAVALRATSTPAKARILLAAEVRAPEVRDAALGVVDELTGARS